MAGPPLVSVVTPTWQRHGALLDRCVPSVAGQSYLAIEHVVVSDGPDPELRRLVAERSSGNGLIWAAEFPGLPFQFAELPEHDPAVRWGVRARLRGAELARGDYIAWLDDDNSYRPDHVYKLVAALEASPEAGFAYSIIQFPGSQQVGAPEPVLSGIDTSAIMNRRSILDTATWRDNGLQQTIDWDLVDRWLQAGIGWVRVPEVTCDYYRELPEGISTARLDFHGT